ncbi:MAG: hypothetical protein ACKV22_14745 [Bryobacteraceae bacterium]
MNYESAVEHYSKTVPGVSLIIGKISFGRRLELAREVRELAVRHEFLAAGSSAEKMEAALIAAEIEKLYVRWGVKEVRGLDIDGEPATPDSLTAKGPEALFREAAQAVASECGLSDDERKN